MSLPLPEPRPPGTRRLPFSELFRTLLSHPKSHVALKRLSGCRHLDETRCRTARYDGFDLRTGDNCEGRCCAVEGDTARVLQIVSQQLHGRSHLLRSGQCFYKRAQANRQAKDRTFRQLLHPNELRG